MVLLLLFLVLALSVTSALIINKRAAYLEYKKELEAKEAGKSQAAVNAKVQLYEEYHLPINDDVAGATKGQTYDINPIKFTLHKYEDDKIIGNYLQIDGLQDEVVESKINEKLKNRLIEYGNYAHQQILLQDQKKAERGDEYDYDRYELNHFYKYKKDGEEIDYWSKEYDNVTSWKAQVSEAVLFNGANAISIILANGTDFYPGNNHRYININLNNGEDIKIEELFTKDYSVLEGYISSIYNCLSQGEVKWKEETYTWTDDEGVEHEDYYYVDGEYERVNVELQEKLANKFKYTKDITFGFSDETAVIELGNISSGISFAKNYDKVALFNRFKSDKDLYDGKYVKITNVPAYFEASKGTKIREGKFFEQKGNVVVNYNIKFSGSYEDEVTYQKDINFAINKISEMINYDVERINNTYNGDNLIIFSEDFEINLSDVEITNEEHIKYKPYINEGLRLVYWDYSPEVVEITKDDFDILKNNFIDSLYNLNSFKTYRYIYNNDDDYQEIKLYEVSQYTPYYREIRGSFFKESNYSYNSTPYFNSIYSDCYIASDNYRLANRKNMTQEIVQDSVGLAHCVFDSHPEIWNYIDIDRDNYRLEINPTYIDVSFPYYHTGKEDWDNYDANYWEYISLNKVYNYSSFRSPVLEYDDYFGGV